jgi:hypothetical protein
MRLLIVPQTDEQKAERIRLQQEADALDPQRQLYFRIMDSWLTEVLRANDIPISSRPGWAIRENDICLFVPDSAVLAEIR